MPLATFTAGNSDPPLRVFDLHPQGVLLLAAGLRIHAEGPRPIVVELGLAPASSWACHRPPRYRSSGCESWSCRRTCLPVCRCVRTSYGPRWRCTCSSWHRSRRCHAFGNLDPNISPLKSPISHLPTNIRLVPTPLEVERALPFRRHGYCHLDVGIPHTFFFRQHLVGRLVFGL